MVVADDPQRHWLAAQLAHGIGQQRGVGVIHGGRAWRRSRRDQLVAGRDDGHARPAEHGNIGPADRGKQSGLAGREQRPSAQYQLAPGHVGAGEAQIGAGGHRVKHLQAFSVNTRVLDHQHGIGAARQHPTGGNGSGRARLDNQARDGSRGNLFAAQSQASRRFLGCSIGVVGAERIAVHVGPVERRHIDLGRHVRGQHPPQRGSQANSFGAQRHGADGLPPQAFRRVAVHDIEELLLLLDHRRLLARR